MGRAPPPCWPSKTRHRPAGGWPLPCPTSPWPALHRSPAGNSSSCQPLPWTFIARLAEEECTNACAVAVCSTAEDCPGTDLILPLLFLQRVCWRFSSPQPGYTPAGNRPAPLSVLLSRPFSLRNIATGAPPPPAATWQRAWERTLPRSTRKSRHNFKCMQQRPPFSPPLLSPKPWLQELLLPQPGHHRGGAAAAGV